MRTLKNFVVVIARHIPREPRLDANDDVPIAGYRIACCSDIGALDIHRVAFGKDTGTTDVDQNAARLARGLRYGNRVTDAVGTLRTRIDETGDTVGKT